MNEKQKAQTIHYLNNFVALANSFFSDGHMEFYNYWKGQVMGICKMSIILELDIDTEYYLKQLI